MSYRKSRHHRPDQIPAWAVWIVLGIFLLAYHLKVSVNLEDDASFVHALDNQNLISWSINQYHTWSSRTLIEAVMVTMRIYGPNLWRILNTGMYVLIGVLISWLFTEGTLGGNCVIAAGILMLFGWDLNDAGQIASSMNYIWPMGCALLAMIPMKRVYGEAENGFGKSHRGWEYLCLLPALYASNEEMTAVFVTGSAAVAILYSFWQGQKIRPYLWALLAVGVLGLIYILSCPGNSIRFAKEAATWYPEFPDLPFGIKLRDGFLTASYLMVRKGNYLFLFLGLLMTLGFLFTGRGYKTHHNRTAGMVSAVFTVPLMISGVLRPMMAKIIPVFSGDDYIDKLFVSKAVSPWAEAGIFLLVWILLFGLLIFACETMEKAVPAVYMLLFGLGAKTVMGFSPTVFASGNRTGLFLLIGVITATVLVYEAAEEKLPDWVRVCGLGIYSLFGMYVMTMQIVALCLA